MLSNDDIMGAVRAASFRCQAPVAISDDLRLVLFRSLPPVEAADAMIDMVDPSPEN